MEWGGGRDSHSKVRGEIVVLFRPVKVHGLVSLRVFKFQKYDHCQSYSHSDTFCSNIKPVKYTDIYSVGTAFQKELVRQHGNRFLEPFGGSFQNS